MDAITQWDFSILDAIAAHHTPFFDRFFSVFTQLGDKGILFILLTAALLCFKKTRPLGVCAALALALDLLLCNVWLKPMVGRVRPYALREVALLVRAPMDASFPSGHAAAGFAFAMVLAFRKSRLAIPAVLLAALMAFSRLYLYIHFPTDVLGGIAVGTVCAALACLVKTHFPKKQRGTPHHEP